ncbi:3-hydroxyisobutyrate dehydrogenase [Parvularcula sp. ZS-1/3]|uniref:3-hydroxyisobutyrate dehydrogenase n=1 Tax=Parvularcula mediterranea TaxID=2732508 RepID=A0A7Y3RIQ6_9PROT|nr:3-hydroxyisobutyrate dehydrogenase [Parvularcula mediterranea]NNU14746.1 3-hydroxyisobutyrate dehydrogenase [Parvularcula mediterranea]
MAQTVLFVGLGNMGSGMCANLVKAGFEVHAFDLSKDAVAAAVAKGAHAVEDLRSFDGSGLDAMVTMLPAGKHVAQVYMEDSPQSMRKGTLMIDCSTIDVETARALGQGATERGYPAVDAPVSGGTAAAEAGTLTFMVGGAPEHFEMAKPYLEAMGKKVFHAGGNGNGQAAKIANNMLLAISMIGTCEAFHLAEKLGLDAQTFYDISSNASGQSWSMTSYCPAPGPVPAAPSNRDYNPGFAVPMMLKDLGLAIEAAGTSGSTVPLGQHAKHLYEEAAKAHGDKDFSVILPMLNEGLLKAD